MTIFRRVVAGIGITVVAVALAGCGGSSDEDGSVVGVLWQWNGAHETKPAQHLSAVPDPENYLLLLNDDGTFEAKVDCNQAAGKYDLSGDDLTLELGPMTLAECGPNSLATKYLSLLGQVASQSVADGQLTLGLKDDAGSMFFNP